MAPAPLSAATEAALVAAAREVRDRAYAPYSRFAVGAAILDAQGRIHCGCNVENAAYPQSQCAEATAIGVMVAAGPAPGLSPGAAPGSPPGVAPASPPGDALG
ncbi:MAG: cytidine deaminase, partial [Pseudomonadota bacterium]